MSHRDEFWKLEHLSDAQLLEGLSCALCTQRRGLAEMVAHLGEVEERRLHLEGAYSSMFAYCVGHLKMSEDEACRRIELARLARKFPALFVELANGQLTLSVALALKPVLSDSNHLELLAAARGKCIRQARELLAERFPKPDAPSNIRKLPERPALQALNRGEGRSPGPSPAAPARLPSLATTTLVSSSSTDDQPAASPPMSSLLTPALAAPPVASLFVPARNEPASERSALTPSWVEGHAQPRSAAAPAGSAPSGSRSVIEPLSAQRYRIQFTADASLKQQLEQARDLLRHTYPNGDLGPIVARALQLLIQDLLRRRFGARSPRKPASEAMEPKAHVAPPLSAQRGSDTHLSASEEAASAPAADPADPACSSTAGTSPGTSRSSQIPRAARRAVLERDGLGCSWVDAQGRRCCSQAWLEFDHRQPSGKGGSSEPDNLRLLCRAHNRLAAELAYGQEHIERAAKRRKGSRHPSPTT